MGRPNNFSKFRDPHRLWKCLIAVSFRSVHASCANTNADSNTNGDTDANSDINTNTNPGTDADTWLCFRYVRVY